MPDLTDLLLANRTLLVWCENCQRESELPGPQVMDEPDGTIYLEFVCLDCASILSGAPDLKLRCREESRANGKKRLEQATWAIWDARLEAAALEGDPA